jgi:hypothetical protein
VGTRTVRLELANEFRAVVGLPSHVAQDHTSERVMRCKLPSYVAIPPTGEAGVPRGGAESNLARTRRFQSRPVPPARGKAQDEQLPAASAWRLPERAN